MQTFFFYDLETSGLDPRMQRVMQFAGQRTDAELQPIGQPLNVLIRLSDDILPDPMAIAVTGITPQATVADGISEPEFCRLLMDEVFTPGTITVGFNNVRFDDEFIRHTLWRNFYDPYEWAWSERRSRWDVLDVVRMMRALRPMGIKWPERDGKPINKLELIAAENGLDHAKAHDALSDVEALIQVTRLVRTSQPKLYDYLLGLRDKRVVEKLVTKPEPFVYSSGRFGAEHQFTTAACMLAKTDRPNSVLVYDLRYDPADLRGLSSAELQRRLLAPRDELGDTPRLPVKELATNRCPAVAPLGVLDEAAQKRIELDIATIAAHASRLKADPALRDALVAVFRAKPAFPPAQDVEAALYDGFSSDKDKTKMAAVRAADALALADFHPQFGDDRLGVLLFRYKARQFPASLDDDERQRWDAYRSAKLQAAVPQYAKELQALAQQGADSYLLQELQLWAESIMPEPA